MAIKQIAMPHLGESVTEASIATWLVQVGDQVNKYDPIAEAVSDKVTTEIPSNYSGTVKEFLIETDTDVEIGTPILSIEVEGEADETEAAEDSPSDEGERSEEFMDHINTEIDKEAEEGTVEVDTRPENTPSPSTDDDSPRARYSPAVVRIAQERGIDLSKMKGTGKHGRITRKDVLNVDVASLKEKPEEKPVSRELAVIESDSSKEASSKGADTVVPADGVRKAIAKKMVQSVNEIPHAWMMVEADVTNLVTLRNLVKETFKEREGVSLSYFPFFVKAVVQAIKKHPVINTTWDNGNIIYHKDINISIAVATEEHLYVPVVQKADEYSIVGLTKEINRLATGAREGRLTSKEMQGGTMTVNNTGSFGSVQSMGIINHPQAAILQVESIRKQLVPTDDGGFKAADMVNLCLSIDHRILDGLQAGRFLNDVKENLKRFNDEADVF
ncbi:dihydrolipoamide acetyltransferase family protein [Alkalibacterium iburiense]|uniref:Dihydrolipoamide acetyltransferase component of pyruvate dehydrogenase complex n=1 Tax=Alkalibacterium iburiense TaxID=290589 RepID=A0ABN0X971_9LACT